MYGSASTWTFNVVRLLIEATAPGKFHGVFVSGTEKNLHWGGGIHEVLNALRF